MVGPARREKPARRSAERMVTENLSQSMAATARAIETLLSEFLTEAAFEGEVIRPKRLIDAMRHAALSGGKRVRPILLVETARLFSEEGGGPLCAGAALECVHCYSLVHDDLPAMDDDDLRRGQPTVHRAFDEATAILAGDALLTLAFDIISDPAVHPDPAIRADLTGRLARAAGVGGMAGGQMLDLSVTAGFAGEGAIVRLQSMKTGQLFRFAAEAGAVLGGTDAPTVTRFGEFGAALGLAFQLADDLLDATGDEEALGKRAAKDAGKAKPTLVSLIGAEAAQARLAWEVDAAIARLDKFGERADTLRALCRFVAERKV
jgi:farnesyl diphosphate synthase